MDKNRLIALISERFNSLPEHLWEKTPEFVIFRHISNRKWFALIMTVPAKAIGIQSGSKTDVINLKCDELIQGSLIDNEHIFPAYHMNKLKWITVCIDKASDGELLSLIEMSFNLTKSNKRLKINGGL